MLLVRRIKLLFIVTLFGALSSGLSETQISMALFSKKQIFWPSLGQNQVSQDTAKFGILPIYLQQYGESQPCDSCHRLSEDGMEFFLSQALRNIFEVYLPKAKVDIIGPEAQLLISPALHTKTFLDSLKLPWEKWLEEGQEPLIYRPREFYASRPDKRKLDRIAGRLGLSHLWVVSQFKVQVKPLARNGHSGGLDWSWKGALYNVTEGRFEWAIFYTSQRIFMDLDEDLEKSMSEDLEKRFKSLPLDLKTYLALEPH